MAGKNSFDVSKVTRIGLLIAVEIVLSRFLSISTPITKIGFAFIPLSMIGMMTIAPALSNLLLPVITPVANLFGFDPSALAGILIANDMGGAALADSVATDALLGSFHGLCVASMLGATISFTIPVALQSSKKEHHNDVLLGLLCGISTIPVGCFVSGLVMGIKPLTVLINLAPAILISVIIIIYKYYIVLYTKNFTCILAPILCLFIIFY